MTGLRRILAVASFALYAIAAIIAVHRWPSSWLVECAFPIPSAISSIVYGLELGLTDGNVLAEFRDTFRAEGRTPASAAKALAIAASGGIPRGDTITRTNGVDIGQPLFAAMGMRLFGLNLLSMTYLFLLLMAFSAIAFIGRYDDDRLIFVPLQFAALTCMLMTALITDPWVRGQAPIGGNRFFGILGVLPAFHLFFEFADFGGPGHRESMKNWMLLGVQLSILVLVVLTRSANVYLLAPAICAAVFFACRRGERRVKQSKVYRKLAGVGLLGIVFASIFIVSVPNYLRAGQISGVIWHRAFISYVFHPEWPFGNLRQVYDCTKYIPEGLQNTGNMDRNGHCIWWVYPPNRTRSESSVQELTYGSEYETALRKAYFYVLFTYPRQAMELFFYYKPAMLMRALRAALVWHLGDMPIAVLVPATLQVLLFLWFVAVSAAKSPLSLRTTFGPLALFVLFSLGPPLVAWPSLATSADIVFYMYVAFALVAAILIQMTVLLTWQGRRQEIS
jgi:hypothetical protein